MGMMTGTSRRILRRAWMRLMMMRKAWRRELRGGMVEEEMDFCGFRHGDRTLGATSWEWDFGV